VGPEDQLTVTVADATPAQRRLRVLFVNPLLAGDFSALDIGLTVLATWVNEKTRHRARIADLTFHTRHWQRHLHAEIDRKRPDVIAVSCSTMYLKYIRQVLAEIRSRHPQPIVLGGHHATVHPDEVFAYPEANAVVIGDGEAPLSEYLNRLADGRSFDGVPGLWVKAPAGSAVKNAGVALQHDLDQLRWLDWDLWDDLDLYFRFLGMLYVQGSRGCPYRCTFCDAQGYAKAIRGEGRYFRLRDPRAFAEELAHYYEQYADRGMRLFQMFDPVFTMDDDWVEQFATAYRQLGLHEKLRYSAFSRIDHLTEEKVRLLAQSGCALLRVGVEAGDDHIRQDVYGKRIDTDTIRRIFRAAKANGIDFTAFYILGGPEETQQTFRKTIRLAWELDAARSAFFVYKPFTEAGIEQLEAAGGGVDQVRWDRVDNIAWGGTTYGKDFSPRIVEAYQVAGYGLTFGRRWLRTLRRRGPRYFVDLARYLSAGLRAGLDWRYLALYFHIYEGDNIDQ
jgi:hypothetical protein